MTGVTPLNVPIAIYCEVSPLVLTVCEVGIIEMAVRPTAAELETVIAAVPMIVALLEDWPAAVIVAVPGPTAVTVPPDAPLATVATPGALDDQVT